MQILGWIHLLSWCIISQNDLMQNVMFNRWGRFSLSVPIWNQKKKPGYMFCKYVFYSELNFCKISSYEYISDSCNPFHLFQFTWAPLPYLSPKRTSYCNISFLCTFIFLFNETLDQQEEFWYITRSLIRCRFVQTQLII